MEDGSVSTDLLEVFTTPLGALYSGDCLDLLPTVATDSVDMVFADPPFNLNKDYGSNVRDDLRDREYLEWCALWLDECVRVLAPGGALWVYNLPKWNIEIGHRLTASGLVFRHWVAIDLKLSLPIRSRLYPSHYSALYFTKGKPKHFERPRIPVATCRHCGGDIKDYGGQRKKLHPEGVNVSDVWTDIVPVRTTKSKTRVGNQLSEKMMERIIRISTAPGDLVLDPFGGSGTTYAVAERLGRHWLGVELGDCVPIVQRLVDGDVEVPPPNRGDAFPFRQATVGLHEQEARGAPRRTTNPNDRSN